MTRIIIESAKKQEIQPIVEAALAAEAQKLEIGLKRTRERLKEFEERYGVATAGFIERMAAEDLAGGDLEYVEWVGEYRLLQKIEADLAVLKDIEYAD
jgi:hypothetical protein